MYELGTLPNIKIRKEDWQFKKYNSVWNTKNERGKLQQPNTKKIFTSENAK